EERAAEEGGAVRREKHRQGIAVQPGQRLHRALVALGDVRALVAVHADRYKEGIDQGAERGIGVHLAIHLRAPATFIGADVEEDRAVQAAGETERLAPPALPADRLPGRAREIARGRLRHLVREWTTLRDAGDGEEGEREDRPGAH